MVLLLTKGENRSKTGYKIFNSLFITVAKTNKCDINDLDIAKDRAIQILVFKKQVLIFLKEQYPSK